MVDHVIQDNTEALEIVAAIAWAWTSFSFTIIVSICCPWTIPFTLYRAQRCSAACGAETTAHRKLKPGREFVPPRRVHAKAELPASYSDGLAGRRSQGLVTSISSFVGSVYQMAFGNSNLSQTLQHASQLRTPCSNSAGVLSGVQRSARWLLEEGPRCSGGFGLCDDLLPEKQQCKEGLGGSEQHGWETPTDDSFSEGDGSVSSLLSDVSRDEICPEEEQVAGPRAQLNEGAELPPGWEIRISHSLGRAYFCNRQSGLRRWTVPDYDARESVVAGASTQVGAQGERVTGASQAGVARIRGGEGHREARRQDRESASGSELRVTHRGLPEVVPVGARLGGPGRGTGGSRLSPEAGCDAWSQAPSGPPS